MARDLGVGSSNIGQYYFISYTNADQALVAPIVKALKRRNVDFWYDGGILTGQQWETSIADNIQNCEAVIMFLSKNTFGNEKTYVKKEYDIAVIRQKRIYTVLLDDIQPAEVPNAFLSWWIDLQTVQCLKACDFETPDDLVFKLCKDLGCCEDAGEKLKLFKEKFGALSDAEKNSVLDDYLAMFENSEAIQAKTSVFVHMITDGFKGMDIEKSGMFLTLFDKARYKLKVGDTVFRAESEDVFHPPWGSAEKSTVYRDREKIYIVGGLCNVSDEKIFYDERDDLLFVCIVSEPIEEIEKYMKNRDYEPKKAVGVVAIERPLGDAVAHYYKNIHTFI